jgi:hypothetical protein
MNDLKSVTHPQYFGKALFVSHVILLLILFAPTFLAAGLLRPMCVAEPNAFTTALTSHRKAMRQILSVDASLLRSSSYDDAELVFDWLEFSFPDILSPTGQPTQQTAETALYRFYPGTHVYIGTYGDILYYLDAQGVLYAFGDVGFWVQTAENDVSYHFYRSFGLTLENIYWGDFHAHSNYSWDAADCGAEDPPNALEFARSTENADLDFVALNDHAEMVNMAALPAQDEDLWQSILRISAAYNNEDPSVGKVFIVFPGWEYTNTKGVSTCTGDSGYGHKNVVFKSLTEVPSDRLGACVMPPGRKVEDAQALWERLSSFRPSAGSNEPKAFTFIHTPAHLGPDQGATPTNHITDWEVMDLDFTRYVEIISKWGNSEGPQPGAAGCLQEDEPIEYEEAETLPSHALRNILYQKWIIENNDAVCLAFIGGTDNHMGHPGSSIEDYCDPNMHYLGGLTGIAASTLTRDSLWSSLAKRHTQASTTGTKIPLLLGVQAGGQDLFMGDRGNFSGGTVRVRALTTASVAQLDIIVDGCLTYTATTSRFDQTFELAPGRHFIYARARINGDQRISQAWTSPVYLGAPQ